MDEKQTRHILDLLKKHYKVGDSLQSDKDWVDSHIQNIYKDEKWESWRALEYVAELRMELEKRYT